MAWGGNDLVELCDGTIGSGVLVELTGVSAMNGHNCDYVFPGNSGGSVLNGRPDHDKLRCRTVTNIHPDIASRKSLTVGGDSNNKNLFSAHSVAL